MFRNVVANEVYLFLEGFQGGCFAIARAGCFEI